MKIVSSSPTDPYRYFHVIFVRSFLCACSQPHPAKTASIRDCDGKRSGSIPLDYTILSKIVSSSTTNSRNGLVMACNTNMKVGDVMSRGSIVDMSRHLSALAYLVGVKKWCTHNILVLPCRFSRFMPLNSSSICCSCTRVPALPGYLFVPDETGTCLLYTSPSPRD